MNRDPEPDWEQPPPEPLTGRQWFFYLVIFFLLFVEFRYMWTWCRWFTNC
jgi:hypothetical protein